MRYKLTNHVRRHNAIRVSKQAKLEDIVNRILSILASPDKENRSGNQLNGPASGHQSEGVSILFGVIFGLELA